MEIGYGFLKAPDFLIQRYCLIFWIRFHRRCYLCFSAEACKAHAKRAGRKCQTEIFNDLFLNFFNGIRAD